VGDEARLVAELALGPAVSSERGRP